ncbi:hypothetical protein [Mesobacterium pallidum]|uniref:hypothetical protein n=1 Tax=Mesobacterium pallidum TaxID=2872037 RepID=UPI001EE2D4A0|nr:hypothetical protein [Mesobacterium pallidum]
MDDKRQDAVPGSGRHDKLFALIHQQVASRPRRLPVRPDAVDAADAAAFLASAHRSFELVRAERTLVDRLRHAF